MTQLNRSLASSLREHVLEPLETAERAVERERAEVLEERRAFTAFERRVAGIEPASSSSSPAPIPRILTADDRSRAVERIRSLYRETVMSVDHYEEQYGESLVEHVTAELSAEVAASLQRERGTPFTALQKETLMTVVEKAIGQYDTFCTDLNKEADSLDTTRTRLADMLSNHNTVSVPDWYQSDFEAELEDIAKTRQERVQNRMFLSREAGHDFCSYLYRDAKWTYPVLTAVARFRQSVP